MSDETQTEEEPSIEEILDSIRQIISEDDESPAASTSDDEEVKEESEPMDQSAIDDMDFDSPVAEEPEAEPEPMDQSAIDDIDFDAPTDEGEPLELTEQVGTAGGDLEIDMIDQPEEDVATEPEPVEEEVQEEAEPDPIAEPEVEPIAEAEPEAPVENVEPAEDILTDQAKEAAFTAMSELVRKTAVDNSSALTIEDIVRSELRPLLRTWLDEHLPTVIDRLVREELERVSKRVLED